MESVTKENFNQLLGKFSTNELENLLDKFPYFQQAHVLLAKKYQQHNNPKFDEQLQLAVLYSQDREWLASIFDEENIIEEVKQSKEALKEIAEIKVVSVEPEIIIVAEEEPTEAFEIEVQPQIVAAETTEEKIVQPDESILIVQTEDEKKETFTITEPHTFDEWLSAFATSETIKIELPQKQISPEPEEEDKELEQLIVSNLPMKEMIEEETQYSKGLETFIEEQKQKHKPQEARTSTHETEMAAELITETMAKIYEMQKKYTKAIHAYEILALKYPEKNDFFAARINYLKNII